MARSLTPVPVAPGDVVIREDSVLHALDRSDFLAAVGANPEAFSQADRLVSRRITR